MSSGTEHARLRAIPSVDRVLTHQALQAAVASLPQPLVADAVRATLDALREEVMNGGDPPLDVPSVAHAAHARVLLALAPSLRPLINATGVIIHTNLGRAPLSEAALEAMRRVAVYSNLEYDLGEGERGSRYVHAAGALRRLLSCDDALVVNNNAAAIVLVLSALCAGREAILSRGQAVEIGGGFRIPEIMRTSGARLVEVGTTNRTYLADYTEAVTSDTALLMRVHTSNFKVVGFTTQPSIEELARAAQAHSLVLVDDLGSGAILDTSRFGLAAEPTPQESLRAGADLVLFSGDKLLGGPQCGIIAGRSDLIARLKKHPLARVLRVDKMTLAALEATLLHYLKGEAEREVPVWRMISATEAEIEGRAEEWRRHLSHLSPAPTVIAGQSAVGGGSLPGEHLPTRLLSFQLGEQQAGAKAAALRRQQTPVIARTERGALLLDPRTVLPHQEADLLGALGRVLSS